MPFYEERPRRVEALLVTEDNMDEVAAHFGGRVVDTSGGQVVEVRVGDGAYVEAYPGVYLIRLGEATFVTRPKEQFESDWRPIEDEA